MNLGKTLFAQLMEFVPWTSFARIVARYAGDARVWCAIATYVLIAIVKKELHLNASLYTCLQILSVSIFEKTQLSCALQPNRSQTALSPIDNQLILFDF